MRRVFLVLVALFALAAPALAREEIRSFQTNTELRVDGSVDVTEAIEVNAEGDVIKHGIFRDIPVVLVNPDGSRLRSELRVQSVQRDGNAEPYATESIANGIRIRIGNADILLDPGPHSYIIHYTMTRMTRFFADHDELYWNATGNFWDFPIVSAVATVVLPNGAGISGVQVFTGAVGSRQHDATATYSGDNLAVFRSNRELAPGEGMTIVAEFQKGVVHPPTGTGATFNWLSDHREIIVPWVAVILVLLYNLFAWNAVGRDPARGTIIPLFHPPDDTSPALAEWVHRMGFKNNGWMAFTAAIFDLGVRGLVRVDNAAGTLTVTPTGARLQAPLPPDEQGLYDYFSGSGPVTVNKSNGPMLNKKRANLVAAVVTPNTGVYFNLNVAYVVVGVIVAVVALALMVLLGVLDIGWLFVSVIGGVILGVIISTLRNGRSGPIFGFAFAIFWVVLVAFNTVADLIGAFSSAFVMNTSAVAAVSIAAITMMFGFLMRAPTLKGRKLMDQIDGFVMYLRTAEKNRMNVAEEPPMTIRRFEAILPFAIALGVEKPWSDRFNAALAANAVADARHGVYTPIWYSGNNFSSGTNISSSVAAIATGMSAAMMASQPAQSSSSGFSGGSSGGGGGGGGGGGW